jgi:hypothetical protein
VLRYPGCAGGLTSRGRGSPGLPWCHDADRAPARRAGCRAGSRGCPPRPDPTRQPPTCLPSGCRPPRPPTRWKPSSARRTPVTLAGPAAIPASCAPRLPHAATGSTAERARRGAACQYQHLARCRRPALRQARGVRRPAALPSRRAGRTGAGDRRDVVADPGPARHRRSGRVPPADHQRPSGRTRPSACTGQSRSSPTRHYTRSTTFRRKNLCQKLDAGHLRIRAK